MKNRRFALNLALWAGVAVLVACSRKEVEVASAKELAQPSAALASGVSPAASGIHSASSADAAPADALGIAWRQAASGADVDAAFAEAKQAAKPIFVYWGAKWCPPCNQVKATLFNRQDFIERSRAFVPVYIDGDSPGAQKLGARFKVRGYPTMVLFNAEGTELTRLPGEVDPQQYTQVLTLGMSAQRPVTAVLADARRGGQGLTPNDWKLLAFYSWETDEQGTVPQEKLPAVLKQLAAACPADQRDAATRLFLKAWAGAKPTAVPDTAARERLLKLLADAEQSRVQMDVLTAQAAELTRSLSAPRGAERRQLVDAFDASLSGLANDATLSRTDRLTALIARTQLTQLDAAKGAKRSVPAALLADVREQVQRADREVTDAYERQTVITTAADLLEEAGVPEESDALLKSNLAKSHSPYYLMLGLAGNAKRRGDVPEALRWYEEAFSKSEGPATRLQWGERYLTALVDLAPQDASRIEQVAQQLLSEAATQPDVFYERSARSLQKAGSKLVDWRKKDTKDAARAAVVKRLQAQLDGMCRGVPQADAQRSVCESVLKPAPAGATRRA